MRLSGSIFRRGIRKEAINCSISALALEAGMAVFEFPMTGSESPGTLFFIAGNESSVCTSVSQEDLRVRLRIVYAILVTGIEAQGGHFWPGGGSTEYGVL
jgi:hypothetical protein